MADKHVQPGAEPRENMGAGERFGGGQPEDSLHAGNLHGAHSVLRDIAKDELRRIPVLRAGEPLAQGATYIDLAAGCTEFTASGNMVATPENWYVRKETVDYRLWNKLTGAGDPARQSHGTA